MPSMLEVHRRKKQFLKDRLNQVTDDIKPDVLKLVGMTKVMKIEYGAIICQTADKYKLGGFCDGSGCHVDIIYKDGCPVRAFEAGTFHTHLMGRPGMSDADIYNIVNILSPAVGIVASSNGIFGIDFRGQKKEAGSLLHDIFHIADAAVITRRRYEEEHDHGVLREYERLMDKLSYYIDMLDPPRIHYDFGPQDREVIKYYQGLVEQGGFGIKDV